MRRRLNWLVLAVTGLLVVAFVVPLGLLVRRQAAERAQVAAEQRAQSTAAALAVAVAGGDGALTSEMAEAALVAEATLVLPGGEEVGSVDVPSSLAGRLADGRSGSVMGDRAWYIGLPVATPAGVVGVVAEATAEEMSRGVWRATGLLALLALVLVAGSLLLADRLGRAVVEPTRNLARIANRLASGELEARAEVAGPPEIRRVAEALNGLASRLGSIITGEREALADLSHRLRTPLTALRMEAERLAPGEDPGDLLRQVERAEETVNQLIREVRERGRGWEGTVDVVATVSDQLGFWSVIAADQGRSMRSSLHPDPLPLRLDRADLVAAFDALVGNVFHHTPTGTGFSVVVESDGGTPVITIADDGPGFPGSGVMARGASAAGSTGLGIDIARRLCEQLGGHLETGEGPGGGALVSMRLGN